MLVAIFKQTEAAGLWSVCHGDVDFCQWKNLATMIANVTRLVTSSTWLPRINPK
jgi:hypothetical protein